MIIALFNDLYLPQPFAGPTHYPLSIRHLRVKSMLAIVDVPDRLPAELL